MKKIVQKFFNQNKNLLKYLLITLILLMLSMAILFFIMINNMNALNEFLKTNIITKEVLPFTIVSFVIFVLLVIFSILFTVLIIKIVIPDRKSLSAITMESELKFIFNLPKNIKKEIIDKEREKGNG